MQRCCAFLFALAGFFLSYVDQWQDASCTEATSCSSANHRCCDCLLPRQTGTYIVLSDQYELSALWYCSSEVLLSVMADRKILGCDSSKSSHDVI